MLLQRTAVSGLIRRVAPAVGASSLADKSDFVCFFAGFFSVLLVLDCADFRGAMIDLMVVVSADALCHVHVIIEDSLSHAADTVTLAGSLRAKIRANCMRVYMTTVLYEYIDSNVESER